jgi:hypothetical protein
MTSRGRKRQMKRLEVRFGDVKRQFMQTEDPSERRVLIKESQKILAEFNILIGEQTKLIYAMRAQYKTY